MIIEKLINAGNITKLENNIKSRLETRQLIFGNKIQLAELNILSLIEEIKTNEEYFKTCEFCQENFSIDSLHEIDDSCLCQECIDNYYSICEECGELVYNDDIQYFNENGYCEECYFEVKQEAYKTWKIKNPLLVKLNKLIGNLDIYKIEFTIDNHLWSIENYSGDNFRLGSFGANGWIDIGNCKDDLIKAIDYNIGINLVKLNRILIDDNTEIEL